MEETVSLAKLREEQKGKTFSSGIHQKAPWLFNIHSLFYFFWFVFLLGIAWVAYSLFNNSMTQLYGWDYSTQYIDFTYNFWDIWHAFFRTGHFALYNTGTFLGSDNIGSNSYYGLFDPFLTVCYIFPRSWVPQTFVTATLFKACFAALAMRAYLKYMGCQETTSRLGAVAYAFSGFVNFFVGFPSFVTVSAFFPLVLLGIEKVIKERKPSYLVFGLFLLGVSSFFFLVVVCIWGVIYALWRYFWTLKSRKAKENWAVIGVGIGAFAVGIMLSSWSLFPSLRESALSGRTQSIGSLYLAQIKESLKGFNLQKFFSLMFMEVGGHPAREIQPLTGFFFPTVNYLWSPLLQGTSDNHYDAWTSSLFVYTPFLILFFTALVSSIRRKKVSHLIAFALCCYLLFTNFAYFFFFAFTGDGYGRWYIVLIPEIIYYAAQELDRLKEEPKWVLPTGSVVTLALTALTWVLTVVLIKGKKFVNVGYSGYFQTGYLVPGYGDANNLLHSCLWVVYFQIGLVVLESIVMFYFQHKKNFWAILMGFMSVEVIIWGNASFAYGSSYSFQYSLDGGSKNAEVLTNDFAQINANDTSYFRSYLDTLPEMNSQNHFGYNGTSNFHSLYNFDLAQLAHYSHITRVKLTYSNALFGGQYDDVSWGGYYGNKRFGFDTAMGMKYYAIQKDPYIPSVWNNVADNVPFGSELVLGQDGGDYLIYRNPAVGDATSSLIGHAVEDKYIYQAGVESSDNKDNFFTCSSGPSELCDKEVIRNEGMYLNGAIINNNDIESLKNDGFTAQEGLPVYSDVSGLNPITGYQGMRYKLKYNYFTADYGPCAFLKDPTTIESQTAFNPKVADNFYGISYARDTENMVFYPSTGLGTAFNTDPMGAYFEMSYTGDNTRILMIGDKYDSNGHLVGTNELLSYEFKMIINYNGKNPAWSSGGLFGFYPQGKVRYIVFNAMPTGSAVESKANLPTNIRLYMMERSAYDAQVQAIKDNALQNVKYSADNFTCTSNFDRKRLVVTSLGYDVGWRVIATDAAGNSMHLKTYKLDGGLVGFVAPEGERSYHLFYQAKYLKEGALLAMGGFGLYSLFEILVFIKDVKREHQAMGITIERKPFMPWHKKKDEDSSSPQKPNAP